jgi:dephospho-CoA kinase
MANVIINIIGNICSGKTTLVESLKDDFSKANFFSIDEYREKYGSFDAISDQLTGERLLKDIKNSRFSIVESSGAGKLFTNIKRISQTEVFTFMVICPSDICLERYQKRPKKDLQISDRFNIEDSLYYIERKLLSINPNYLINGKQQPEMAYREFHKIASRNESIYKFIDC